MTYKENDLIIPIDNGVALTSMAFLFMPKFHTMINDNDNYRLATEEEAAAYNSGGIKVIGGVSGTCNTNTPQVEETNKEYKWSSLSEEVDITNDISGWMIKQRERAYDDNRLEQEYQQKLLSGFEGYSKLQEIKSKPRIR